MRVLLDTDVVLDLIMGRVPFAKDAAALFDLNEQGECEIYISALTPVNVLYIARKAQTSTDLRQAIQRLVRTVTVCPIDFAILDAAFGLPFDDYEDATQHCCAATARLDGIVTRNVRDYKNATLPVFTPADFLKNLQAQPPQ